MYMIDTYTIYTYIIYAYIYVMWLGLVTTKSYYEWKGFDLFVHKILEYIHMHICMWVYSIFIVKCANISHIHVLGTSCHKGLFGTRRREPKDSMGAWPPCYWLVGPAVARVQQDGGLLDARHHCSDLPPWLFSKPSVPHFSFWKGKWEAKVISQMSVLLESLSPLLGGKFRVFGRRQQSVYCFPQSWWSSEPDVGQPWDLLPH